jgi:S-(hydroxymethyl)glutathione dehydrogenase/alcohol dehydrogenase
VKAAVLRCFGEPLSIEEVEIPALGRGQVLVKLAYSGVCHSQLMEVRGNRGADKYLPHLLGHEGTGVVVEIGSDVTKVRPGEHVILGWIRGDGIDAGGCCYRANGENINSGAVTTFNEYSVVSENRVTPLPKGLPLDIAVLFGCALLTGAGIVMNEIRPDPGTKIAIFGLGGIGLSALIATQLFNFSEVIAVDVSEEKLQLAREFGATRLVRVASDVPELVRDVDYAVEASGLCEVIETAFGAVRRGGGLCVFASHPKYGEKIRLDPFELISGKQIKGSWGGNSHPDRDVPKLAELYLQRKLPFEKLIEKKYAFQELNQALEDLESRRVVRPVIDFNVD